MMLDCQTANVAAFLRSKKSLPFPQTEKNILTSLPTSGGVLQFPPLKGDRVQFAGQPSTAGTSPQQKEKGLKSLLNNWRVRHLKKYIPQSGLASCESLTDALLGLKGDQEKKLSKDFKARKELNKKLTQFAKDAYKTQNEAKLRDVHKALNKLYDLSFVLPAPPNDRHQLSPMAYDARGALERLMIKDAKAKINPAVFKEMPKTPDEYMKWFTDLIENHPTAQHPFYTDYMPNKASAEDIKYYLTQESYLDGRFDDNIALTQVGAKGKPKLELAGNFWDEMGNGKEKEVHTTLFLKAMDYAGITPEYEKKNTSYDALLSGNLSSHRALDRSNYYRSIGYMGVTEYLAPRRFTEFLKAWSKNGLPKEGEVYHTVHVGIDEAHAKGWFENAIKPAIEKHPEAAREIAEGALIRLSSSQNYLDNMRQHLSQSRQREQA